MPSKEKRQLGMSQLRRVIDECIFSALENLEAKETALTHNEDSIRIVRRSFFFKFRYIYRPLQMILGVLLALFALLIFVSLLLSNINKCLHFVNFKQIFAQGNKTLPNPIDSIVTWTGQVTQRFI